MNFITDNDLVQMQVRNEVLAILKIADTTLDFAELAAQKQMTSYLKTRYDVPAIFTATTDNRDPLIIMYMIDLMLYHMHSAITTRVMPKQREDRYNAAMQWLKDVSNGDQMPDLPELPVTDPDPLFRTGTNRKYSRRW